MKNETIEDLRTPAEWREWAEVKIAGKARILTYSSEIIDGKLIESGEMAELELGDCIEFDPDNPLKQRIVHYPDLEGTPPNFTGVEK